LPVDSLGTDFDTLLTRGAVLTLLLAAAWGVAVVLATALEARTHGRLQWARHTGCPPAVRLWLVGLFTAVFAGMAPAHASDQGTGPDVTAGSHVATRGAALDTALEGLPLPDRVIDRATDRQRPPTRVARSVSPTPAPGPAGADVVVAPGDSLWRIASRRLPHGTGDATVAATVAALYAANRAVVGPDPDRLEPGQHLVFPDQPIHPEEP
jgi:LysM repeat protein